MTRTRVTFICTDCGNDTPRWQGQCPACQGWNTLVEDKVSRQPRSSAKSLASPRPRVEVVRIADVEGAASARWRSGIDEFDFVLGGGVVPGSVVLVGGEPGLGKTAPIVKFAARIVGSGKSTLYVSGEESAMQVRLRADRLEESSTADVQILPETDLSSILERVAALQPDLLLIDSIQTVYASDLEGVPGSVSQVRECAARLQRWAKEEGTTVFLVGHVTKAGGIAGPKTLEHIVDTVLYFERAGDVDHRVLRATKNRFGGVDEIGVFRMTAAGLLPVSNPSELFLGDRVSHGSGCAVTSIVEGSRPLLVEIQALAARASYGAAQRVSSGFDQKRLALLLAVLEKRASLPLGQLDVFLNVVGGLRIIETAVDAAVAAALISTVRDTPISSDTIVLGEIGLGGELRPVGQLERRLAEAARMGFTRALVPRRNAGAGEKPPLRVTEIPNVAALLEQLFV